MQSTIKNAIYKDYVDDMHRRYQQEPIASLATFYETWRVVFPHCQIRPYCQILGKCDDCADIDYIKRTEVDPDKLMAAAELHSVHRGGKFMLERSAYMRRKKYAMEHPDRVMSIIIDKMDQSHCVVPYKGTQTQLNHALKIGLTGVKEHGVGVTFYRTIDKIFAMPSKNDSHSNVQVKIALTCNFQQKNKLHLPCFAFGWKVSTPAASGIWFDFRSFCH